MALGDLFLPATYSVVDELQYEKQNGLVRFSLLTYQDSSKLSLMNKASFEVVQQSKCPSVLNTVDLGTADTAFMVFVESEKWYYRFDGSDWQVDWQYEDRHIFDRYFDLALMLPDGENIIKRCYEYLKRKPIYQGLVDVI